jgi:adenylate cyclase
VIHDEARMYGDGINVAARLEGIALPGGICVSEDAYRQIRDKVDAEFADIGEQSLKNIARPVRAYKVVLDASSITPAPELPLPSKPSIAVLPFHNMSGDPEQEYLAYGMVEDIITGLSRIRWLFVIARNSTLAYKGRAVDVKQIGRELGVRYVVEGSVRRSADRLRVTGQLITAETGAHVWAERYDRKIDDVFAVQDEITLSVVGAIEPTLRLAEIERVKRKRPESLDAYELVLQSQADVFSRMPAQSERALVLLERALSLDPSYALAHAYAAECHHSLFLRGGMHEKNKAASMHHAEAAIANGGDDAAALTFAAFITGMEGKDRGASMTLFNTALTLSPSCALAYIQGSIVLAWGGEDERASEWAQRGLRLSPFDPWRATAFLSLAVAHFQRERYQDAADAGRRAVQATPGFSISYLALAAPLVKLGLIDEAKAAAARLLQLQPGFRYGQHFARIACEPRLAAALSAALRETGLPE